MTIASEIQRIKTNIANAYTACDNKGATMPVTQNSANLADCIDSISGGGGDSGGKYLVQVIDYDGTILKKDHLNTGATFTLPSQPSHTGLTFQSWSSPVTITNNTVTVTNSDITIGATYTTASGLSEFDITLTEVTGLSVTLNMNGTKDWGDGTSDTSTTHTYSSVGNYTITCNGSTMTTSSSSGLFGQTTSVRNYYVKNVRLGSSVTSIGQYALNSCSSLTSITIPSSVTSINTNALQNCYSLISITIPSSVTSIGQYAFNSCYSLTSITIPSNVTSINAYVFMYCYSLTSITIPSNVTSINYSAFQNCYSLTSITIPNRVTSISNNAFNSCSYLTSITIPSSVTSINTGAFKNCFSVLEYNLRSHTTIPTLSSTDAFDSINQICKIYVSWDLYQEWIVTTNWSTYANYIDGGTPATLNFIVTPSNSLIYVNNSQIQGTSTSWIGTTAPYVVYDSTNNVVLSSTQTGITEGASINITADLTTSNKITLLTGVSGLTATATIDGLTFPMTEESSGNYSINVVGSGITINYFINGGSNYMDTSGSVTTTGSDVTEVVTLTPAIEVSFVRPDLTADGTLGGNSFAVKDVGAGASTLTYAWRAVDSSATTYWNGNVPSYVPLENKTYVFYNPDALKVSELTYTYSSTSNIATAVSIEGSNDNSTWEAITSTYSGSSTIYTSTLTNSKFYKYYKLTLTPYSSNIVRIYNLAITATYKILAS